ncbi:trypsin-like peptidase domain-containing protein [Pseudoglutamicibacter cumminsii]|uniref:S1C family serine protease n=1 Tax=Pseudoglutamicibacter cumminsii TaxID=156979 RepID=UPI002555F1ED|nr:trypsin-like peptidase domain-containing protein [Pseudoglutamicibacter cumminsii]MDK7082330.1 trypsin-like peptidase domain-containing protein [Pseudoglutamicibacter cumminsii]
MSHPHPENEHTDTARYNAMPPAPGDNAFDQAPPPPLENGPRENGPFEDGTQQHTQLHPQTQQQHTQHQPTPHQPQYEATFSAQQHQPSNLMYGAAQDQSATEQSEKKSSRRPGWGIVAGALIVGAIAGGGAGAGVLALNNGNNATQNPGVQQEVRDQIVANPKTATTVSQAAQSAMPSVVTISASGNNKSGSGSGVIVSEDGYVLTNQHVATLGGASDKATIEVQTADGTTYPAKLVGQDPLYDLAVVKLENTNGKKFSPITFANMDDVNVGSDAIAIGAPLGLPNTVSTGIISNRERSISIASSAVKSSPEADGGESSPHQFQIPGQEQQKEPAGRISINVLQTDASINHGNSGGALVNNKGELIGINVAIYAPSEDSGSIGLGFAVSGNIAQRVANELMSNGKASHGQLGLLARSQPSNEGRSAIFTEGAVVSEVPSGSPAGQAGIQKGDVITKVGGKRMNDAVDLTATIRSYAAGTKVPVTIRRDGQERTVEVTLGNAEA